MDSFSQLTLAMVFPNHQNPLGDKDWFSLPMASPTTKIFLMSGLVPTTNSFPQQPKLTWCQLLDLVANGFINYQNPLGYGGQFPLSMASSTHQSHLVSRVSSRYQWFPNHHQNPPGVKSQYQLQMVSPNPKPNPSWRQGLVPLLMVFPTIETLLVSGLFPTNNGFLNHQKSFGVGS